MTDSLVVAALLLVVGPVVGGIGVARPALFSAWTAPRAEHLALVRAHRRGWAMANAGFATATLSTAAGLAVLAGSVHADDGPRAVLLAAAVVYSIAGTLWCAGLAIRDRTTPALAEMVAAGTPTEPAEALLGAAFSGLFSAFMLTTGASLAAIGLTLAINGGVTAPVAWLATLIAAVVIVDSFTSRVVIPAVVYFPTLFIGLALLLGWR
jgi:MFS family permease